MGVLRKGYFNASAIPSSPQSGDIWVDGGKISVRGDGETINPGKITNVITVGLGGDCDYTDINSAIIAAAGSTYETPFAIIVGPGVFLANEFTMPKWCSLVGQGWAATTIQIATDNASSNNFITGAPGASISAMEIIGPADNTAQKAAIHYEMTQQIIDDGEENAPFFVDNCNIGGGYCGLCVDTDENLFPTYRAHVKAHLINNLYHSGRIEHYIKITGRGKMTVTACSFADAPDNSLGYAVYANGPCEVMLKACDFGCESSTGVYAINGALVKMNSMILNQGDIAIHIGPSTGGTRIAGGANLISKNGYTTDLYIEGTSTDADIKLIGGVNRLKFINESTSPGLDIHMLVFGDTEAYISGNLVHADHTEDLNAVISLSDVVRDQMGLGIDEGGTLSIANSPPDMVIRIAAGYGHLINNSISGEDTVYQVEWDETEITMDPNSIWYFYVDNTGTVQHALSLPNTRENVYLGRAVTLASSIDIIEETPYLTRHAVTLHEDFLREIIGSAVSTGLVVSAGNIGSPLLRTLDVSSGVYWFGSNRYAYAGGQDIEFDWHYHVSGVWVETEGTQIVPNDVYDDGVDLVPVTPTYYIKHVIHLNASSEAQQHQKFILTTAQAEYATLEEALAAPLPISPHTDNAFVQLYSIICQEGNDDIVEVIDERKRFATSSAGTGGGGVTVHDNLTGRESPDNHLWAMPLNGTKPMTGSLNMGTNAITNVGLVDGVDVSAHSTRHQPGGADALATAAAVSITTVNAEGNAITFARSNHTHKIEDGTLTNALLANMVQSTIKGRQAGSGTGVPEDLTAAQARIAIDVVQSDTTPLDVTKAAASAGASNNVARYDHKHDVSTAAATTISYTNAEGNATSLARSNHTHAVSLSSTVASETATWTSTNAADTLITTMTLTPAAGTYLVTFSCSYNHSNNTAQSFFSIYSGGSQVTGSERRANGGGNQWPSSYLSTHSQAVVTVNGAQAIEARARTAAATLTVLHRNLILVRLS